MEQQQEGQSVPAMVASAPMGELPSVGELFRQSFSLMRERIWVMFLSFFLPILAVIGAAIVGGSISFIAYKANHIAGIVTAIVLGLVIFVGYIYALMLAITSQIVALRDVGEKTGAIENLKRSRPFILSFFLIGLLVSMAVMGGVFLLIVPGVILAVKFNFAQYALILEGKKGRAALAQSKAYVLGRTGKVFWRLLLMWVIIYIPVIILNIVSSLSKEDKIITVIAGIIVLIIQIMYSFFSAAYIFTLYKHLKNTAVQTDADQYVGGVTGWVVWGGIAYVLAIIAVVVSVGFLAVNYSRVKRRDALRVAQVKEISSTLEMYYSENESYPTSLNELVPTYTKSIPVAPQPADGDCVKLNKNDYSYNVDPDRQNYKLEFCLGAGQGGIVDGHYEIAPGVHTASYDWLE